jgi:sec-independent protein translocase protein TatB
VFDVSFSELLVIAVVAMLVIGPEKLPKVARTVGAYVGRMQRYVAQVKDEVNREMRFEELKNLQQEIKQTVEQEVSTLEGSIHKASSDAQMILDENAIQNPKKHVRSSASPAKSKAVKTSVAKAKITQTAKAKVAKPKVAKPKTTVTKPVKPVK